ncbi:MAG: hypothetical protein WCQ95_06730 [Bacteroidota bacterium]
MAKHKKKKVNHHHLEKVARAQHKNEYYRKIRKVLHALNCDSIFSMIPNGDLEALYTLRFQSVNITIAEGERMPAGARKYTSKFISEALKEKTVKLLPDGAEVDLDTYLTAGITMMYWALGLDEDKYAKAAQIKKDLNYFCTNEKIKTDAWSTIHAIVQSAVMAFSDLNKRLYYGVFKPDVSGTKMKACHLLDWHSVIPERVYFQVNGERHNAVRVGHCSMNDGPKWVSVKAKNLGVHSANPDKEFPVYIQAHALQRIAERNDCVYSETLNVYLYCSLQAVKCQRQLSSGKFLIDFEVVDVKTGYLLADIIDDKLIIRTFLFMTQEGMPESDKLKELTGLQRSDIQYLDLDKLSTFMTTEVHENPRIRKLFADAGCDCIFKLREIIEKYDIPIKKHPAATLLEKYIGLDDANKFFAEEEMERKAG